MKPYAPLFVLALALAGCTNGLGEVDVTKTQTATFPGAPAAAGDSTLAGAVFTTDGDVTLDVRKDLASLNGLGTVTGTIEKNAVAGPDLAFIEHIRATIATQDGKPPVTLVPDIDIPRNSSEVELPLSMSDARVLEYLAQGKVTIHFYVTGNIPERPITLTHTMIAHMSVAVKGSVLAL